MFKRIYITQTENLQTIRPAIWKILNKKYKKGFSNIGIEIPQDEDGFTDEFWETMAATFKTFELTPETSSLVEFLDDLETFIQSDTAVHETLQEISEQAGIEERFLKENHLPENEELSIPELAVIMLLDASTSGRLKAFRSCISVDKSAFRYFSCSADAKFQLPKQADLTELTTKFKTELKVQLKIKGFCRIDKVNRKTVVLETDESGIKEHTVEEWWFTIQRENRPVISPHVEDEDIKTISYTPPTTDIIVVNPKTCQISTNVQAKGRRDIYLHEFARVALPAGTHYVLTESETYTFKPLETDGWEHCFTTSGNDELRHVRLKEVRSIQNKLGGAYDHIDRAMPRRCLAVVSRGNNEEDKLHFQNVNRIHLEFLFAGESTSPTLVRIMSGSQISINRKHRRPDVLKWLQERGFINTPRDSEDEDDA